MLWALCACGTKSQFAGSGYTEPGVSTGNAANTSDNIQSPASGASDSDNMDEFAWLITQTRFGDAAKYLHPTAVRCVERRFNGKGRQQHDGNFWHNTRRNMPGLLQR